MQGFLPIPALEAPADGMAFVFSAPKGRPGWAALTGGNLSGFTAGQLAIGASAGGLTQDATLSYSGGVLSASNLKSAGLTSGRVTFATTGGQLTDSANLTYSGGTLSNAGGDTATSGKFLPNNSVNAFLNGSQGAVYGSTTGGGSFPFTSAGNLVLEARGNGNNRAVVLASGGGAFTAYLDAVGTWNVPSTTASTTTSSGAVVIGNGSSGGLGVGGAINVGGGGTFGAKLQVSGSISGDVAANFANTSASGYGLRVAGGTSGQYLLSLNDYASTEYVNVTTATFAVKQTTDSTSTTTGALVVSGGVAVGGAVHAGGIFWQDAGASDSGFVANSNAGTNRSYWMFSNGAQRWRFFANNTAEAGANAGSDFQLAAYDDSSVLIDLPLTVTRAAAGTVKIASGRPFQLGNAYVATPPTCTGYVTVKDSTGTTYKLLCAA